MLVGHYGIALALKKANKSISLGLLFLVAMIPDIILGLLVLLGIEKAYIPPNYSIRHYLLFDFPYSHGLTSTMIWMLVILIIVKIFMRKMSSNSWVIPLIFAIAFVSHFLLDFIVHVPEIPLFNSNSVKIGLGLWNSYPIALVVELIISITGVIIYLNIEKRLKPKIGITIIMLLLMTSTVGQMFSPTPNSDFIYIIAIQWIVSPIIISLMAFWLEYK